MLRVKVKLNIEQTMKAQRGKRYSSTLSLILALYGGCSECHIPAALLPDKIPGTHCKGRWVGLSAGLDL